MTQANLCFVFRIRRSGIRARRLAIACGVCAWLAAGAVSAQVVAQRTWPETGRDLWYWVAPQTDFSSEQVGSAFKRALEEELAFLDPAFSTTVFFAKKIRVTTGKAGARKKYKDQPAKADVLRLEVEWQTGYLNQYRGTAYRFIALDSLRSIDLHYLPDLRQRFPRAPAGGNWNVNIYAGSLYNFFFRTEDTARNFINALASLLKQRDLGVTFSRFGLMWENVTPAQAAEIGTGGRRGRPGDDGGHCRACRPGRYPAAGRGPGSGRHRGEKLFSFFPAARRHRPRGQLRRCSCCEA